MSGQKVTVWCDEQEVALERRGFSLLAEGVREAPFPPFLFLDFSLMLRTRQIIER